ncbi:MAG: hypothetical protein ACLR8Y_10945 [Alistipes indistinctus]
MIDNVVILDSRGVVLNRRSRRSPGGCGSVRWKPPIMRDLCRRGD